MAIVLGLDAKLYYNEGTYEAPVWTEITNVKDLTLPLEKGKADVTTRGAGGWRANKGTLKDATITFGMVWDTEDAAFTAIQTAFFDNTSMEFLILDGDNDVAGAQGLRATMDVFKFERTENLEEALMVNVEIGPTYDATNAPEWYTSEGS